MFGFAGVLSDGVSGFTGRLAVIAMVLVVAACQSVDTEGALAVAPETAPPAAETLGSGPVRVLVALPRSAGGNAGVRAADAIAGARLAITDLGLDQLTLQVADTGGSPSTTRALVEQAFVANAALVIGPTDPESVAAVAAIPAARRPPVLSLAGEAPPASGVYAFGGDGIDSAVEGVRAAVGAGQSRLVVLVPEDFAPVALERFRSGAARAGARIVATIRYPLADAAVGGALTPHAEVFRQSTAAVIFGTGRAPATVAQAIVSAGLGSTLAALIGNSAWPRALYSEAVLDGALIALADQESLKVIATRFQQASGRPLSLDAAYAYDAVALAAGLARSGGAKAFSTATLQQATGFRGAAGMFRLHRDGSVERRHAVYRVERGDLVLVQPPGEGF
ncbi:MAG: hypothetical protein KF849_06005 [Rhizobiaceae bacterium]|nr:hypothetical protein [Rhizobiaceae bacterium]